MLEEERSCFAKCGGTPVDSNTVEQLEQALLFAEHGRWHDPG